MLNKWSNLRKSVRDLGVAAVAKINELQEMPDEIPEEWEERMDNDGKPYYVDIKTGEWYRIKAKSHTRINTNEKISIISDKQKKEMADMAAAADEQDSVHDPGPALQSGSNGDTSTAASSSTNGSITNTPSPDSLPNGSISDKPRRTPGHTKRGSTSLRSGWRCDRCTLENKATANQCTACLGPRPDRYEADDDDDDVIHNDYTQQHPQYNPLQNPNVHQNGHNNANANANAHDNDSDVVNAKVDSLIPPSPNAGHRQMSTMEQIEVAMNQSLKAELGDAADQLSSLQRTKLITFMDFTTADPEESIEYLTSSGWDPQGAADLYWKAHPDKAASRPGSLLFSQDQLDQINNYDPAEFEVSLPDDIERQRKGHKRRSSNEYIPSNGNGQRETDDEEEDAVNEKPEEKESEVSNGHRMIPNNNMLNGNGYDDEMMGDSADSSHEEDTNDGVRSEQPFHSRMDTNQKIQLATHMSKAQIEFDNTMQKLREENEALRRQLEQCEREKEDIFGKYARLSRQSEELQKDWDQMTEYMNKVLTEINYVQDRRREGKEIAVPTPKLLRLIDQIKEIYAADNDEMARGIDREDRDIYAGVSNLFPVNGSSSRAGAGAGAGGGAAHLSVAASAHAKGLSFGAVDTLFAGTVDDQGADYINVHDHPSSSSSVPSSAHRLLSTGRNQHEEARKNRLSYGGVESLFSSNIEFVVKPPRAPSSELREDHEMEDSALIGSHGHVAPEAFPMGDGLGGSAGLKVSFEPTYDGIATLFEDEMFRNQHLKKATIGGDIVEMFVGHALPTEIQRGNKEEEDRRDDREPSDYVDPDANSSSDMDEQRNAQDYTYSDTEEEDAAPEKGALQVAENSKDKRHDRQASFALKDLFRGDSDGTDDRGHSHSVPSEDHEEYYAISAFYGIDEEHVCDSRRSSLFGDYGRITSRRQSTRMLAEQEKQNEPIKKMFADKLEGHHMATGSTVDRLAANMANVADLFCDEQSARYNTVNPSTDIAVINEQTEEQLPSAPASGGIADGANVVADLFEDQSGDCNPQQHRKDDTYSGVRNLFPGDDEDDDSGEDLDTLTMNQAANSNGPRPSSNVALWKTFDELSRAERPPDRGSSTESALEQKSQSSVSPEQPQPAALEIANEALLEQRINEERAKIERQLQEEFDKKLEGLRAKMEADSARDGLTERESIREECRREVEEEMSDRVQREVDERLKEEMQSTVDQQIDERMKEMQSAFDRKMEEMESSMNEVTERHKKEVETMERSKYELIRHTAEEIDSLRQIIKVHFQQNQQSPANGNLQNLQFALGGLLKWT